jgi:hypothetical protein
MTRYRCRPRTPENPEKSEKSEAASTAIPSSPGSQPRKTITMSFNFEPTDDFDEAEFEKTAKELFGKDKFDIVQGGPGGPGSHGEGGGDDGGM